MKGRKHGTPRVLVVDDDEHLMVAITQVLHDAGYETRTSYDGHLAIQRLSMGYAPDVIVLDLVMPRVNGFEVLNWMRQHDLQIPIVLATTEDDVRATDVGAVAAARRAGKLIQAIDRAGATRSGCGRRRLVARLIGRGRPAADAGGDVRVHRSRPP